MRKSLLIAGGTGIILLLVAMWVYLLFFGTPKNINDVFTSFDFGDNPEPFIPPPPTETPIEQNPTVNLSGKALRQLTTRPVIGFREIVGDASTTPQLYYAEAGTGHMYSIDLRSGVERRISGTTIIDASRAVFSMDGKTVVIQSGAIGSQKTELGQFKEGQESISFQV